MNQSNLAIPDSCEVDISKCRVRRNSAVIAECVVAGFSCPQAMYVGHTANLIKLCMHPYVDKIVGISEPNTDAMP